uniref:Transcription factor CBF/NF-Y/archaeal histone domain-containing protein n=1 Tax=Hemiselmis andersenii TaxID=464988 RepID=A0A6U4TC86_HEMAN|mmetsp:Transcript_16656/g.38418  ORF Transcript_16656/g.38418 Transcript_16656/m.38418 type:complete len:127 (+) Transcript_16656:414-794(+)
MVKRPLQQASWGDAESSFALERIVTEVLPPGCSMTDQAMEDLHSLLWAYLGSLVESGTTKIDREGRKAFSTDDVMYSVDWSGFNRYTKTLQAHHSVIIKAEDDRKHRERAKKRALMIEQGLDPDER